MIEVVLTLNYQLGQALYLSIRCRSEYSMVQLEHYFGAVSNLIHYNCNFRVYDCNKSKMYYFGGLVKATRVIIELL